MRWLAALLLVVGCAPAPAKAPQAAASRASKRAVAAPVGAEPPSSVGAAASAAPPAGAPHVAGHDLEELTQRLRDVRANEAQRATRAPIVPEPFRFEELPALTIPAPLDPANAPLQSGGDDATELAVDWKSSSRPLGPTRADTFTSVRVSLIGNSYGRLRIGFAESTVNPDGTGGVYVSCGGLAPRARRLVPARWETIEATPKGIQLRFVNAWFDTQACKASIVARASAMGRSLAGGMLYALRQSPVEGAPSQEESLVVIGPRFVHLATGAIGGEGVVTGGSFSRITLPVRRGGAASVLGRIAGSAVLEWSQAVGVAMKSDDLLVGLEVTQGVLDPSPVAIAYMGPAGPTSVPSPVPRPPLKLPVPTPGTIGSSNLKTPISTGF